MSQAKVDKYKKEKANRKKTLAKHKAMRLCGIVCAWAVVIVVVGVIGKNAYTYYESKQPAKTYEVNTTSVDDYLKGLEN